ncbi:MAG: (p)ppGpp synthetase [bacterium]|nr:(p)ppGpp synthetase [bacterium]
MGKNKLSQVDYDSLIRPYRDALFTIQLRLDGLNADYLKMYKNYPIHHIQQRIKVKTSIENKLKKRGLPITAQIARDELTDIAGIRVICYFTEDVYHLVRQMKKQTDLILIKESDYIKEPKENGYRSYHLVLGIPVYNMDGLQYYPVELQIRTLTMDLWASMEHRICYKPEDGLSSSNSSHFRRYTALLDEIEHECKEMCGYEVTRC